MKVLLTSSAQEALETICAYYQTEAPEALSAVLRPIVQGLDLLEKHPRAGPPNRKTGLAGEIRVLVAVPYRILYEVRDEETVLIHSIRHGRQRPEF